MTREQRTFAQIALRLDVTREATEALARPFEERESQTPERYLLRGRVEGLRDALEIVRVLARTWCGETFAATLPEPWKGGAS